MDLSDHNQTSSDPGLGALLGFARITAAFGAVQIPAREICRVTAMERAAINAFSDPCTTPAAIAQGFEDQTKALGAKWDAERRVDSALDTLRSRLPDRLAQGIDDRIAAFRAGVAEGLDRSTDPAAIADRIEALAAQVARGADSIGQYQDAQKYADTMIDQVRSFACDGWTELVAEAARRMNVPGRSPMSRVLRALDPRYWRRRYYRQAAREIEDTIRMLDVSSMRWCSPVAAARRETKNKKTLEWAARTALVADNGTMVPMTEVIEAQAKRQRANLLSRAKGIQRLAAIAIAGADTCRMVTITAPSPMHAGTSRIGEIPRPNTKWDGSSPADAARWFQSKWARVRAALKRREIETWWVLVSHLHKDGTPHWHAVMWTQADDWSEIEAVIRNRFEADEQSTARYEHGLDIREVEGGGDGAVGYISREIAYITREVGGDEDDAEEAAAVKELSSTYGLRRFRTSHSKATVMRLLRRKDLDLTGAGAHARRAQEAAQAGDHATFFTEAERAGLKPGYVRAENSYGERVRKLIGVKIKSAIYVPRLAWSLRDKRTVVAKDQGGEPEGRASNGYHRIWAATGTITPSQAPPARVFVFE